MHSHLTDGDSQQFPNSPLPQCTSFVVAFPALPSWVIENPTWSKMENWKSPMRTSCGAPVSCAWHPQLLQCTDWEPRQGVGEDCLPPLFLPIIWIQNGRGNRVDGKVLSRVMATVLGILLSSTHLLRSFSPKDLTSVTTTQLFSTRNTSLHRGASYSFVFAARQARNASLSLEPQRSQKSWHGWNVKGYIQFSFWMLPHLPSCFGFLRLLYHMRPNQELYRLELKCCHVVKFQTKGLLFTKGTSCTWSRICFSAFQWKLRSSFSKRSQTSKEKNAEDKKVWLSLF